eukprot:1522131-Prymnesium_polylepis.1
MSGSGKRVFKGQAAVARGAGRDAGGRLASEGGEPERRHHVYLGRRMPALPARPPRHGRGAAVGEGGGEGALGGARGAQGAEGRGD